MIKGSLRAGRARAFQWTPRSRLLSSAAMALAVTMAGFVSIAQAAPGLDADKPDLRPRIVVSTDVPPLDVIPGGLGYGPPEKRSDPDDLQSLVRLLAYADDVKIEGLIASAGTLANIARKQNLLDMLSIYDQVDEQLRKHDARYPTADELKAVTFEGRSNAWGKPWAEIIGDGRDSEASDAVVKMVDRTDRPIWFLFWGGSRELAQAIWKVKQERSPEELARFLSKVRVYLIAHQDGTANWLEDNFPDLMIVTSEKAYLGMAYGGDGTLSDGAWLDANVRKDRGPLGVAYPPAAWSGKPGMQEGDTPSLLYILSAIKGLSDVNDPTMGGWGGRFVAAAPGSRHFIDAPEGGDAVSRWRSAFQNDFAARMERTVRAPGAVNRPPVAVLDGNRTTDVVHREASSGDVIKMSAAGSSDPDGDKLVYHWSVYSEASSPETTARIDAEEAPEPGVLVTGKSGAVIQIILEVTDDGAPKLTSYRRLEIKIK